MEECSPIKRVVRRCVALLGAVTACAVAASSDYVRDVEAWRAKAETSLRRDLGWLSLAGRWELKEGISRVGSAPNNDIVLPPGTAPETLGQLQVSPSNVTLRLAPGVQFASSRGEGSSPDLADLRDSVVLDTTLSPQKWIHRERLSLVVFKRPDGKHVLRIADRESPTRAAFPGRIWYAVDTRFRVEAKFVPSKGVRKTPIVNVLGETTQETVAGAVHFMLDGRRYRLDALGDPEDKDLFIILKDETSGRGTYPPSRFLVVSRPAAGSDKTVIDFNKAYNPPCAFSAFTSCPLPPPQNELKVAIVAGERYRD